MNNKNKIFLLCVFLGSLLNLSAQKKVIEIIPKINKDKSVDFYYKKNEPGSYVLQILFSELYNSSDKGFKGTVKDASGLLFTLNPIDSKKHIRYSFKRRYYRGVYKAKIIDDFTYVLPFKEGHFITVREFKNASEYFLNQEAPKNWASFGITRSYADTVRCMRKGLVVKVIDKYIDYGVEKKFTPKKNSVMVEHEDGTFATYKGFEKGSLKVKLGQTVYPQTQLGILDKSNDKYTLNFQIAYFDSKYLGLKIKKEDKKRVSKRIYINPFFKTDKGIVQLANKEEYKVFFDDKIFTAEFSKKEFKKYMKAPHLFK